jgi:hypothetical protein
MSTTAAEWKSSRARFVRDDDPSPAAPLGQLSDHELLGILSGAARVTSPRKGGGAREAIQVYEECVGSTRMPLYLIAPEWVTTVLEVAPKLTPEWPNSDGGWAWMPAELYPHPPSKECFISWGSPIRTVVSDDAKKAALLADLLKPAGLQPTPEDVRGAEIHVYFLGLHVFDPEEEGQPWTAAMFVRESITVPGRRPITMVFPVDLVLATGADFDEDGEQERIFAQDMFGLRLVRSALYACAAYQRARHEVSKKHRRRMRKHGQAPPSEFYIVSQQPIRQTKPPQGGTHASPSFQHDVRGHWAHRVKRITGELDDKERSRWTRKNTNQRNYRFVAYPPTPEQRQFLRDIGRTPPGKGQYLRVTRYWVPGHTRGPEDAPHVYAIKAMGTDNSAGVVL